MRTLHIVEAMLRWPTATLFEGITDVAAEHSNNPALIVNDKELTYGDLLERSRSLASGLTELGISANDTIAVWLGNRPEWIITQLAASYLGVAVVAVNTRYRRHELEYMLSDSGARLIVTETSFLGTDYLDMLADIIPEIEDSSPEAFDPDSVDALTEIIALESDEAYPATREFEAVLTDGQAKTAPEPQTDHELPVTIFYTSGTTGDPKGCLHDSRSVLNHSYQIGEHFDIDPNDIGLTLMPFCGIMGYNYILSVLTHGATAIVQPYFDANRTTENIDAHSVTYCSGTDAMFTRMISTDAFDSAVAESLHRGATFFANGYEEDTFERIEAAVDFPIVQPYGLSEANTQIFVGDPDDPQVQRKRVGGPLIHPEQESARIIDPESSEKLPPGEQGELQLKGYNVLTSYLDKPEKTAESIVDGWLYTGDLCERDKNNYFYFHSRLDDALRVRGFLVSARDIEQAIDAHNFVEQSQVVGAPHPRHGEVPVGFLKLRNSVTMDKLNEYLSEQIADYKQPEELIIVEEFPRIDGPHGKKIQKSRLREQVSDRYTEVDT